MADATRRSRAGGGMRLASMSRKYRPTVADKRYAQTIATLTERVTLMPLPSYTRHRATDTWHGVWDLRRRYDRERSARKRRTWRRRTRSG